MNKKLLYAQTCDLQMHFSLNREENLPVINLRVLDALLFLITEIKLFNRDELKQIAENLDCNTTIENIQTTINDKKIKMWQENNVVYGELEMILSCMSLCLNEDKNLNLSTEQLVFISDCLRPLHLYKLGVLG